LAEYRAVAVRGVVSDLPTIAVERDPEQARLHAALAERDGHGALSILMRLYSATVWRYCRRMLGNEPDGNDVSQIVFLQAFEAIQRGSQIENVRGWLLGIARHRCLDQLVRGRHDPIAVETEELERVAERDGPDEVIVIDPGARQALEDCIDSLDMRSRTVLLLRFHDDLSYEAISELTGDTPGALRVRVARALPALRRCLGSKGVTL